jgi:hypothetical protein
MHAKHDTKETTKAARDAFHERFVIQVDPTNSLPEPERFRRAEAAKKAHFLAMAMKSAKVRGARANSRSAARASRNDVDNARELAPHRGMTN